MLVGRTRLPFYAVPLEPNVVSFEHFTGIRKSISFAMASFLSSLLIAILLSIRHICRRSCQSSWPCRSAVWFSSRHTSMSPVDPIVALPLQHATFRGGRLINCEHRTRTAHDGRSKTVPALFGDSSSGLLKAHSATTPPGRRLASAPWVLRSAVAKQMVHPRTTAGCQAVLRIFRTRDSDVILSKVWPGYHG